MKLSNSSRQAQRQAEGVSAGSTGPSKSMVECDLDLLYHDMESPSSSSSQKGSPIYNHTIPRDSTGRDPRRIFTPTGDEDPPHDAATEALETYQYSMDDLEYFDQSEGLTGESCDGSLSGNSTIKAGWHTLAKRGRDDEDQLPRLHPETSPEKTPTQIFDVPAVTEAQSDNGGLEDSTEGCDTNLGRAIRPAE